MFDHVLLNVPERQTAMKFYTPVLGVIGFKPLYDQGEYTGYGTVGPQFWLRNSSPENVTRKVHIAFSAGSRAQVDEFYRVALTAGGRSNGAPGLREHGPQYYAAFVFDLEGNNIEAVFNK